MLMGLLHCFVSVAARNLTWGGETGRETERLHQLNKGPRKAGGKHFMAICPSNHECFTLEA